MDLCGILTVFMPPVFFTFLFYFSLLKLIPTRPSFFHLSTFSPPLLSPSLLQVSILPLFSLIFLLQLFISIFFLAPPFLFVISTFVLLFGAISLHLFLSASLGADIPFVAYEARLIFSAFLVLRVAFWPPLFNFSSILLYLSAISLQVVGASF